MTETKIFMVDDHKIVCDGLRALLEKQPGVQVVGEALDGRSAVRLVCELSPDIVIMDIAMPDLNGIEATRQLRHEAPNTKVIALSMHSDKRYVIGMLEAGASGYVLKEEAFNELSQAVRCVRDGKVYLSPSIAGVVAETCLQRSSPARGIARGVLSPREREVLQLIAEGWSTRGIAGRLYVSVKTVDTHRRHIMEKLDIHTVADLIKYAVREGLASLEGLPSRGRR